MYSLLPMYVHTCTGILVRRSCLSSSRETVLSSFPLTIPRLNSSENWQLPWLRLWTDVRNDFSTSDLTGISIFYSVMSLSHLNRAAMSTAIRCSYQLGLIIWLLMELKNRKTVKISLIVAAMEGYEDRKTGK